MPIEHALWRIGEKPARLFHCSLDSEQQLEILICADPAILSPDWLLIGRQVLTAYNKYIDLLAVDQTGSVIVIELKKDKTPRDVVAQAMDYATWVKDLDAATLAEIHGEFRQKYHGDTRSLDEAFAQKFGLKLDEESLNSSHQMVIVATEMDASTERIVRYVNEYNIPLNVLFFRVFGDGDSRYLSRAWFIDPSETLEQATTTKAGEPWNGEYYVSFGHWKEGRNWDDAVKYGFISAGGGLWYSRTLRLLQKNDRVWVNVPKHGYVGVGIVQESVQAADEFKVATDKGLVSILEAPTAGKYGWGGQENPDKAEYFVCVKWLKTVPLAQAHSEVGFFGNQNTVARPTAGKWGHTVGRLKERFGIQ